MTIHRHCVVCGQELDAFDIKAHKCVPKEYYEVRDSSSQKIIKELSNHIAKLEQEKIRAYNNGFEDGQKSLQNK